MSYIFPNQKVSFAKKKANDFKWAKNMLDEIDNYSSIQSGREEDRLRLKSNYDLMNGYLDKDDFLYVCRPYGDEVGELPAEFRHYDIISPKVGVLIGEEIKRPFNFRCVSTNPEAVTAMEDIKAKLLKDYVQNEIKKEFQQMGFEVENPDEQVMNLEQIEKYLRRNYSDARETMGQQLLTFLTHRLKLQEVFNRGWRHALISGREIYYIGTLHNEPFIREVNPMYFDYDKDPDIKYIHKGQWAKYEMRMTPSSVIDQYGEYLKPKEIDKIYGDSNSPTSADQWLYEPELNSYFNEIFESEYNYDSGKYVRVLHGEWKSLRKIGFLKYEDEEGIEQEIIVPETYKLNTEAGDISIKWQWIEETWEGTKIGADTYVKMRPKPNQYKNIDNLFESNLGYYGVVYNNDNSRITSQIDRMKSYSYFYDIIMFRLEQALKSDRGKKFLMDINQIPASQGFDVPKWLYYFDSMDLIFINPYEEGGRDGQPHMFNQFQQVDLSMAQTVQQKIQLLEYLEFRCGEVAGVSKQREGQIGQYELATSSQQAIIQSSHITEELFHVHNNLKREVLTGLIEASKVAFKDNPKKFKYVLDDMSIGILRIDPESLTEAEYAIFVSNSQKDSEVFSTMKQLSVNLMQQEQADILDIMTVLKAESVASMEDQLKENLDKKAKQAQANQERTQAAEERAIELSERQNIRDNETKITVAEINSFRNQMDQDINNNQIPDQLEIEKFREQVRQAKDKLALDREKMRQEERIADKNRRSKERMESKKAITKK